jgi:serine/threonine protein phosphatase PrpC
LQSAYEETLRATTSPTEWLGTTTSATAILHYTKEQGGAQKPLLYVTNLGDCKILVIRPAEEKVIFRTAEQWHWFDCPMQLGTNSIDTPRKDAVLSKIALQEDDIILALSDGVMDNLWEHEVLRTVLDSINKWEEGRVSHEDLPDSRMAEERNVFVARELLNAALAIAQDPFAESPFMEKAIDEGLAIEGGKMDDISVVVASCKKRAG